MIEENSTWYIPKFNLGANYKLAKYQDTSLTELSSKTATATIGLLRMGELMTIKMMYIALNVMIKMNHISLCLVA